jgi:DDE superfamily endonuclease
MCEDAGVILAYLPPYSPDFNPIEQAVAQLKQWIKKNRILATGFGSFEDFLRLGLDEISSKAKGHFRKCMLAEGTVPRDNDDMEGDLPENEDNNMYYNQLPVVEY